VLWYRVGLQVGTNLPSVAVSVSLELKEEVSGCSQLIHILSRKSVLYWFIYFNTTRTDRMHYLHSVYFNNEPPNVSSRLTAHHQEVLVWIYSRWYIMSLWRLAYGRIGMEQFHSGPATSMAHTNCCIYRVYLLMMSNKPARNMWRLITETNWK
jgi:hypothetical protein